ncbi:MAG: hypothetical protein WC517_01320 [Patescibacteria group bacterium]
MDVLKDVVSNCIPMVNNEQVSTHKGIVWTKRYECPCCFTHIEALVDVFCTGLSTAEGHAIEGLYHINIEVDYDYKNKENPCRVVVVRLVGHARRRTGDVIHDSLRKHLPRGPHYIEGGIFVDAQGKPVGMRYNNSGYLVDAAGNRLPVDKNNKPLSQ